MSDKAIKAYQGKDFTITLQASPGSTGYSWCLTGLPKEFALFSYEMNPSGMWPGAPVNQVFRFFALGEPAEVVYVEFTSIRLFDPRQTGEKLSVGVSVIPYNEADGLDGFVKYSDNAAAYTPAVDYGFPMMSGAGAVTDLYGFPNCDAGGDCPIKYGFPMMNSAGGDCPVKYGFPMVGGGNAATPYGYPMTASAPPLVKYGYFGCPEPPPLAKYGFYGCVDTPPLVKYGFYGCV
jgi:hypothetical protein